MRTAWRWARILPVLLLIVLGFSLTGCGIGEEKGRKPGPDWSKGLPLSSTVIGTVGMAAADGGAAVHLAWMETAVNQNPQLRYVRLDERAEPVVDTIVALPHGRARAPRLLLLAEDRLMVVWALRPAGGNWELWSGMLDGDGRLAGDPVPLSAAEMNVGSFVTATNAQGEGFIVWEENRSDQLFGARVGPSPAPAQALAAGENPHLQVDAAGDPHLAWRQEQTLYYAPLGNWAFTEGTAVADIRLTQSDSFSGPSLGLTDAWVYLVWSVFSFGGMEANTGSTSFVAFPVGQPQKSVPQRLLLTTDEEMPYVPIQSAYNLTQLTPPAFGPSMASSFTIDPDAAAGRGSDLALIVASDQTYGLRSYTQMMLLLLRDGRFLGFQPASRTQVYSSAGALITDAAGHLYMSWHEGGGNRLYYATTQPAARAAIDRLRAKDIAGVAIAGLMESVVGILLFPFALLWVVPGAVLLGVFHIRRAEESMDMAPLRPGVFFLLILALGLYYFTKLSFLPTILEYVPFSAWLDVPPAWQGPLRLLVPLAVLATAVLVAEWMRRRRPATSALLYYFVVCGVDTLFTLAIYGVNFLGTI